MIYKTEGHLPSQCTGENFFNFHIKASKKLELNEEYKRSNKKFDDKFEEMYQEIGKKMGNNRKSEFEDLMFECRTIEEYKQNLYFLVGFLDGIKFFNMLHKIV